VMVEAMLAQDDLDGCNGRLGRGMDRING
jgi:hypothetical protein